jgi:glucosamine-phosphate N-acetyltransferase
MWSKPEPHPHKGLWSPQTTSSSAPSTPLFAPTLLSPEVIKALPEGYSIRPLQRSDYRAGMLDVLRVLTSVGDISEEAYEERYEWMAGVNGLSEVGMYYILVIECEGKIVGTGGLVVERKL